MPSPLPDPLGAVSAGYDLWAQVYDHDANPMVAMEDPLVRRAVGDPKGLRVLDLGCGTGRHALWLAAGGAEVWALDFSEGMLREARAKPGAEAVHFRAHDLHEPLPFEEDRFDLVVSGLVLEHLRALGPFFGEIRRVLGPSGRAVISAMHPAMFLRGVQARFTDPTSGERVMPGSVPHPLGAMVMAALGAGFHLEAVTEWAPDGEFAARFPRAAPYEGWPMLVLMCMQVRPDSTPVRGSVGYHA
jgi:SAM-dependent methyltransferase